MHWDLSGLGPNYRLLMVAVVGHPAEVQRQQDRKRYTAGVAGHFSSHVPYVVGLTESKTISLRRGLTKGGPSRSLADHPLRALM